MVVLAPSRAQGQGQKRPKESIPLATARSCWLLMSWETRHWTNAQPHTPEPAGMKLG